MACIVIGEIELHKQPLFVRNKTRSMGIYCQVSSRCNYVRGHVDNLPVLRSSPPKNQEPLSTLYIIHVINYSRPLLLFCTSSDRKLGGAWEQGYM